MTPLNRAELSLEGLSVGDAFGQMFFGKPDVMLAMIERRALPAPPWQITDDSIMGIGVVETLRAKEEIDQDYLAERFAVNYMRNMGRGYGTMARYVLAEIVAGADWRLVAPSVFGGAGSYGNGGAMRVAPVGAFFAEDLDEVCRNARRSAEVTHSHAEGQAGAIAVAAAAAWAWNSREKKESELGGAMLRAVSALTPPGETRAGIEAAASLPFSDSVDAAVALLGNGSRVASQDTVPFALWCAARHFDNFEDAMWATVSGLGDRDTTCAIVGGILALRGGAQGIPTEWRKSRESLRDWR